MPAHWVTNSNRGLLAVAPDLSWLTPRWAARVLGIYAAAAVGGALVFLVCAALLALFSDQEDGEVLSPTPIPKPTLSPIVPPDTVNEDLIARANESLKLISVACSAAEDQGAPLDQFREVTYTGLESEKISKALVQGVGSLRGAKNLPCIQKSVYQLLNLGLNQNLPQVFNLKFFISQRNGQTLAAAHVDTSASSTFHYCVPAPPNEQFVPETARLVIDKGDRNSARIAKVDTREVCVTGQSTSTNPIIETHVEVVKITKIDVPMPPNTLSCEGFNKNSDGTWSAGETKPFDIGNTKQFMISHITFGHHVFNIGGVDPAVLLEQKCGTR